ncbi:MAG: ribonuclease BN [Erythrobacteraceae bacterium]|nr:ribonuclease BN [Erythrobacteraceae bacterium]
MVKPADLKPPSWNSWEGLEVRSLSPEARRRRALLQNAHFTGTFERPKPQPGMLAFVLHYLGPGTRIYEVVRRTSVGTWQDGFIHAGNLAYLSMLALVPFFILGAALFTLFGGSDLATSMVRTVMAGLPPSAAKVLEPVAEESINARSGWLLWLGAGVALWTVSSLIETIRDILRRAYGTKAKHSFLRYRLFSAGLILGAVVVLLMSLFAQVAIGTAEQVILTIFPQLNETLAALRLTRLVPAFGLVLSLYMLFLTLTPEEYRGRAYPKWPGVLFTAAWWFGVTVALPPILRRFFTYDLTYGSMAGIIIALFFFWLVGLGLVIGAELNAALAEPVTETESGADDEENTE